MNAVVAWFQSEQGRRVTAWCLAALGALVQGGVIPLDMAIPGIGVSVGQVLPLLGITVAATSGSQTRK